MIGVRARKRDGGVGPADPAWRCPVCGTDHDGWVTNQGRVVVVDDEARHPAESMGVVAAVPDGVPTVWWSETVRDRSKCYWLGGDGDAQWLSAEEAGIDQ